MSTVAIYARVSTEEQTENFSINAQLDLLRSYCRSMNYEIYDEYVDPGYSGTTQDRPALQKLLEDARKGRFQLILVYRIDRFFRSVKDLLIIVDYLDQLGIAFRSVTEPFDTTNPIGKFMLSLLGSIAQLERDTFIERSQMGKIRRAKEGYVLMSRPLYGYDYDKASARISINEKEAEVVRFVYAEYLKPDASTHTIPKMLKMNNANTKHGGIWNSERVYKILTHPAYVGDWYYKHKSKNDPSNWILVTIPPIIDRATFDTVQELLKKRRNMIHRSTPRQYLLRGFLRCKKCGMQMGGTTDVYRYRKNGKKEGSVISERYYYRCTRTLIARRYPERGLEECDAPWLRGKDLEDRIFEYLISLLMNPEKLKQALNSQRENIGAIKNKLETESKQIEKLLARCEIEKERILKAYREGAFELDVLTAEMGKIKERQKELSQKLEEIKLKAALEEEKVLDVETVLENYQSIDLKDILEAPYEEKRAFLSKLVKNIWVDTKENGLVSVDIECIIPIVSIHAPVWGATVDNKVTVTPLALSTF